MNNVTPIRTAAGLHAPLAQAIDEQQNHVWHLRNLIECLEIAHREGNSCEDFEAAAKGLITLADMIHLALDEQVLAERAAAIEEEARLATEREGQP